MAWRDELQDATFRGVSFQVRGRTTEGGRRSELHEYPLRDLPWAEDLGKGAKKFQVEGYVLGPDYLDERDALEDALNAEGGATLVLPWRVSAKVVCLRYSLGETTAEGGMATFGMEFTEAGDNLAPSVSTDTQSVAAEEVANAKIDAGDSFASSFGIELQPEFVTLSATDLLAEAVGAVNDTVGKLTGSGDLLFAYVQSAQDMANQVLDLARAPQQLAVQMFSLVAQVRGLARTPAAALDALRGLLDFGRGLPAVLGSTPARIAQRANQAALCSLVRHAAATETVLAVADMDFPSYDEAVAVRDGLEGPIDDLALEAADAGDDQAYAALRNVRLAMIADVTARGGSLARLFTYQLATVEPALVLSYRIYGNAGRDAEIVDRNRVRHPGFVPAATPIELLTPEAGVG
ncbi:MAG: circulation-like protein [Caulobacter sp.]|nr:circulation-like protein [Caulobacter sp.]